MNRVIHFEVQADDIERAKKFYQDALGWKISQTMTKEDDSMDYWGIATGDGPGIDGGMYQRPAKGDKFYLYNCMVDVPDIDKAIESVEINGGKITKGKTEIPGIGLFAGAEDTEGNRFGLMQQTGIEPIE